MASTSQPFGLQTFHSPRPQRRSGIDRSQQAGFSANTKCCGTAFGKEGSHPAFAARYTKGRCRETGQTLQTPLCNGIRDGLDVRSIVKQTASMEASHTAGDGNRASVEELIEIYQIDETLTNPAPVNIGIFDDVLTVGRHYRAMHTVLSQRFPGVPNTGIFIARTIHPNPFEDIDLSGVF